MNNLEEFKKDLYDNARRYAELLALSKRDDCKPSQIAQLSIVEHRVSRGLQLVFESAKKSMSLMEICNRYVENGPGTSFENEEKFIDTIINKLKDADVKDLDNKKIEEIKSLNQNDRIKYFEDTIKNLKPDFRIIEVENHIFNNFVFKYNVLDYSEDSITNFFDKIDKLNLKFEVPEAESYAHFYELGDKSDVGYMDDEINDLIKNADKKDTELINALEESKKLLIMGRPGVWNFDDPSERIGDQANIISNIKAVKRLEGLDFIKKDDIFLSNTKRKVEHSINITGENKSKLNTNVMENRFALTSDEKQRIRGLVNLIRSSDIDFKEKFTKDSSSQGIELFLTEPRTKLDKAIKEKDFENIKKYVAECKKKEETVDKILNEIESINPTEMFPGNISAARNRYMPAKYRNNVAGASKFNGICVTIGYCERFNYDFNNFIEDPIKAYKELGQLVVETTRSKYVDHMKNSSLTDLVCDLTDNESNNFVLTDLTDKEMKNYTLFYKIGEAPTSLFGPEKGQQFYNDATLINIQLDEEMREIETYRDFTDENEDFKFEMSKRMILAEPEDRDYFAMSPKSTEFVNPKTGEARKYFDVDEYRKTKTSPQGITLRALEVYENYLKEPYSRALHSQRMKNVAIDAIKMIPKAERTADIDTVIKALESGKINKIDKNIKTHLRDQATIFKNLRNGINSKNFAQTMTRLSQLQKTYDSHGFFSKRFNSAVKNEKNMIDGIYLKLSEASGKTVDEIKKVISQDLKGKTVEFADNIGKIKDEMAKGELGNKDIGKNENARVNITIDELDPSKEKEQINKSSELVDAVDLNKSISNENEPIEKIEEKII